MPTSQHYLQSLFDLDGKPVIIAGGAGVIGQEMAKALLSAGGTVTLWSRTQASIDEALTQIGQTIDCGDKLSGDRVDTSSEEQVADGIERLVSRHGSPEILINAVGGNMGKTGFIDLDTRQFESVLQMNLLAGLVIPTKLVAAHWIEKQIPGTIINLASMTSYKPLSGVWAYNAAKSAVLNLTQATAREFAPHNIRVNAIAPGFFLGKQNRAMLIDEATGDYTERGKQVISRTPFGRFGDPAELAGATCFLASNRASGFVTGISIPVDGGFLVDSI